MDDMEKEKREALRAVSKIDFELTDEQREADLEKLQLILQKSLYSLQTLPYHELHETADRTLLPKGVELAFTDYEEQTRFVSWAKRTFKESEGPHKEEVNTIYFGAIQRRPSFIYTDETEEYAIDCNAYPVFLSDMALSVLTRPENLRQLSYDPKIEEESTVKPAGDSVVTQFRGNAGKGSSDKGRN